MVMMCVSPMVMRVVIMFMTTFKNDRAHHVHDQSDHRDRNGFLKVNDLRMDDTLQRSERHECSNSKQK